MLGHKTSVNKFSKTEIIQNIVFNHYGIKAEIKNRKKTEKPTDKWKLSNSSKQPEDHREITKYYRWTEFC